MKHFRNHAAVRMRADARADPPCLRLDRSALLATGA